MTPSPTLARAALARATLWALGASCLPAAAQTVTLYGVLDAAVEHLRGVGPGGRSLTRVPGFTGSLPSRLGLRGSEDLGQGLHAVFTLEQGLALDSGLLNQGGRSWGRQAFVGLTGPWGSLSVGRQYSMLFWSQLDADILGPNAYGSASLDSYLPNARADNAIAYRGHVGMVTMGFTYSLGRDAVNAGPSPGGTNCAGERPDDARACRQWSALLKVSSAAAGVALAVDEIRGGPEAFAGLTRSDLKDRRTTIAAWSRLDAWRLGAGLIARDNQANAASPRSDLWYAGLSYEGLPGWTLDAQVFDLDVKRSANAARLYAARATYALSKRSALYATAGRVRNDGNSALSVSNAAAGGAPAAGQAQTGLALGMRHSF